MIAQVDKCSLNNIRNESDNYGERQLLGLQENDFDDIENGRNLPSDQTSRHNSKLLGRTTSSICGLRGIKGHVTSAIHEPTGQIVAVKRYKLETEDEDYNSCYSSQEKFNEDVTFILVSS